MVLKLGSTRLWQTQENKSTTKGNVRIDSVYGTDSDETLLTGLESQESFTVTGIATGNRLAQQSKFSNDPNEALAEWVVEMETYVNGSQGSGWTFQDDERGDTFNVLAETFGWQRNKGERLQVLWDLSLKWAQGMMEDASTSPDAVNPSTTWKLDGKELPGMASHRQQKRQRIKIYPIALADPGQNEGKASSGATRQIMIRGQVTDQTGLNSFDDRMQSLIGQDTIVDFESAFPGRTKQVMVRNYDSIREAGRTRLGDYTLELVEGIN